jgi:hypothetical protein
VELVVAMREVKVLALEAIRAVEDRAEVEATLWLRALLLYQEMR